MWRIKEREWMHINRNMFKVTITKCLDKIIGAIRMIRIRVIVIIRIIIIRMRM